MNGIPAKGHCPPAPRWTANSSPRRKKTMQRAAIVALGTMLFAAGVAVAWLGVATHGPPGLRAGLVVTGLSLFGYGLHRASEIFRAGPPSLGRTDTPVAGLSTPTRSRLVVAPAALVPVVGAGPTLTRAMARRLPACAPGSPEGPLALRGRVVRGGFVPPE